MANEIHFPDLGDFKDVLVIDVMVKVGDRVERESPLVTLETDKATMDVPSPSAGVIGKLHVAKGDKVNSGGLLATLEDGAGASEDAKSGAAADAKQKDAKADAPASSKTKGSAAKAEPVETAEAPQADEGSEEAADAPKAKTEPVESAEAPKADEGREKRGVEPVESAEAPKADEGRDKAETEKSSDATKPEGEKRDSGPAPAAAATPPAQSPSPPIDEAAFGKAHASPSVRAFARELGVDLGRVRGSGRKGRVTGDDVKAFVKTAMTAGGDTAPAPGGASLPRVPAVDFAKFGPIEVVPLTRIQRISGPRLHASWVNLPHVTQFDDADVTELEEARRWLKLRASAEGIGLTSLAFVLRACVLALKAYPKLGASLDPNGQGLVLKKYCHLGFAADTPDGLVVPVIRDADQKDVFELARALGELSGKARTGKLSAAEMQGGCFTVSNLGGIGGTAFTPIINAPEVAVLGVSRASHKPVWKDGAFVPRLMLPLSLSYDHRVVDGADGARFVGFLAKALADVAGLMAPL